MPASAAWRPILDATETRAARSLIDAIAARAASAPRVNREVDLASGASGVGLFYSYLASMTGDPSHARYAQACFEQVHQAIDGITGLRGVFSGPGGIALAREHVTGNAEDAIAELILRQCEFDGPSDYDLLNGASGLVLLACSTRSARAGELADAGISMLLSWAQQPRPFWTPPARMIPRLQARFPDGYLDLGVAHGIPGVIATVAQAIRAHVGGASDEVGRQIIVPLMESLRSSRLPGPGRMYPTVQASARSLSASRLAWCYGDAGIAAALMVAARSGVPGAEEVALEAAESAVASTQPAHGIVDASLCHGSAGLGLIFHRLWQWSDDERFLRGARFWYRETLARYFIETERSGDLGFLTGTTGVGLAMLAAISDIEPSWDAVLLISPAIEC